MAKEIKLPQISEGVASAQVAEVLVSEGDIIEKEQSIIAVETDKASVEVPATESGKVKEIKVKAGDEIKAGDVILILEEEESEADKEDQGAGEEAKEEKKDEVKTEKQAKEPSEKEEQQAEKPEQRAEEPTKAAAKPEQKKATEQKEEAKAEKESAKAAAEEEEKKQEKKDEPEKAGAKEPEEKEEVAQVPASPGVRRLAREMGVDIQAIAGSGEAGRITEEDIKAHAGKPGQQEEKLKQPALPDFSQWGEVERKPLSNIRKAIAENTAASWHAIPHVTHFDEADISGIEEYRKENSKKAEVAGGKLTITAILVKIAANALQRFSMVNASIDTEKGEVILKKYVHIGIAVDTEKGLLVPVIRNADKKSLLDIAVEITALSGKARDQKLSPEEMQGGNFVVSNLGGIGGTNFTPIVYHPQVAILGVSKAKWQPVYLEGIFVPRLVLPLSLSYDHRLIDGAEGARFLRWIGQALEDPYKALLEV